MLEYIDVAHCPSLLLLFPLLLSVLRLPPSSSSSSSRLGGRRRFRKLDIPGEMRRFKAGLASAPVAGFMVTYNKHTLSLEDLGTLEELNWVNDQVRPSPARFKN